MAIQWRTGAQDDALIAEINTTPLVDVMLVLLIIFLITIPVVSSSVAVSLPREAVQARQTQAETVLISVDAQGAVYWFDTRLPDTQALLSLLGKVAVMSRSPRCTSAAMCVATTRPSARWSMPASRWALPASAS
jgi:biopolymer transport protein ExbD